MPEAVIDGGVDVAVGIILEKLPDRVLALKRDAARLSCHIEKRRNDGALADVTGDVLFGVVRTHLFLVDVLLEDVAEDVRVNFIPFPRGPVVKGPVVSVE